VLSAAEARPAINTATAGMRIMRKTITNVLA